MYLEKLEIQGFKSFANKTALEFPAKRAGAGASVTAIVGPNGSGKSNIADAVRWVLGEQSGKLLRGKKSQDVIFSGSRKLARLGFAEVAIHLNNENKKISLDYEKVTVRRRLFRDGESEYRINSSQVRLADILLLLAQCNLGHRTYSVVGQGMVDAVLNAGQSERKEFFDEATGVRQHQIKKEQALKKIEETRKNLRQVSALVREIAPRLKMLERQKERLQRREGLEKELNRLQEIHYRGIWARIEKEKESLALDKARAENEERERRQKLSELDGRLARLADGKASAEQDEYDKLQKEYQKILNQKEESFRQLAMLEGRLEILEKNEVKITSESRLDLNALRSAGEKCKNFLISLIAGANPDWEKIRSEAQIIRRLVEKALAGSGPAKEERPSGNGELKEKIAAARSALEAVNRTLADWQKKQLSLRERETKKTQVLFAIQKEYQKLQADLNRAGEAKNEIAVRLAKVLTHREDLEEEMARELSPELKRIIKTGRPENTSEENLWPQIAKIKRELEMIGGLDQAALEEYGETKTRHEFLSGQAKDLNEGLNKTRQALVDLEELIDKEFNAAFAKIQKYFQENFAILFSGGQAGLAIKKINELESLNEELAGALSEEEKEKLANSWRTAIDIKAVPPGKRVANLNMLSGGERALTSIALICAIIQANPSPFVVLDEVDAALDEANSERFAKILQKMAHQTQFITITHNRATMEKANLLYGVTMGEDGVSKLLSLDLEKAETQISNQLTADSI